MSSVQKQAKRKTAKTREQSPSSETKAMRVMGLDPGLAKIGMAVVEFYAEPMRPKVLMGKLIETKKASQKELKAIRVVDDDQRRLRHVWDTVRAALDAYDVAAVGIESFAPIPGQQGHGGWKTGASTMMLVSLCWSRGMQPIMARPGDLRRAFLGKDSGSKIDIQRRMVALLDRAQSFLDLVARSKQEHVADAMGYAVVAQRELLRLRELMQIAR